MSVVSLKFASLKIICLDLYSNYLICMKNCWKLPESLGNYIYQHYSKNDYPIDEFHVKFFKKEITSLSSIAIKKKFDMLFDFYENLDKKSLKQIDDNCFSISREYKESIVTVLVKDTEFLEDIVLRCDYEDENIFNSIISSAKHLKKLDLYCYTENNIIDCLIEKCSKIESFILAKACMSSTPNFSIYKCLSNSSNNLKELELKHLKLEHNEFIQLINECYNLEIMDFSSMFHKFYKLENIFNGYNNKNNKIKILKLKNIGIELDFEEDFQLIFQLFPNIEKIYFYSINSCSKKIQIKEFHSKNILKKINLKNFKFKYRDFISIGNILKSCKYLKSINLANVEALASGFSHIFIGLLSSQNTLESLNFTNCVLFEDDGLDLAQLLEGCSRIEKLKMSQTVEIAPNIHKIFSSLANSSKTLRNLQFNNCNVNENDCEILGKVLSNCTTLERFEMNENCRTGNGLLYIFQGLSNSLDSLSYVDVKHCQLNRSMRDYFIEMLPNFQRVEDSYIKNDFGKFHLYVRVIKKCEGDLKFFLGEKDKTYELEMILQEIHYTFPNFDREKWIKNFSI